MMKRPLVGVGVLVRKKDSYLLIKRHNSQRAFGIW